MKISLAPHISLILLAIVAGPAIGQDASEKKPAKTPTASEVVAVVGGEIHTVTQGVIRGGTILIKDGKIAEMGQQVEIPEGAQRIDASGKIVTPGFVAINMRGVGLGGTPSGRNKLVDSLDPFDQNIKYALGVGITSGCASMSRSSRRGRRRSPGTPEERFPGFEPPLEDQLTEAMFDYGDLDTALCPCCGLPVLPTEPIEPARPTTAEPQKMAAIKLAYGNLDAMVLKEQVFYSPAPGALNGALNRHNFRVEMKKAKESIANAAKAPASGSTRSAPSSSRSAGSPGARPSGGGRPSAGGRSGSSSSSKAKPELVALLKGESTMRVAANALDEINDLTDLAQEFGYDLVIEGGIEAWVLSDRLSQAGVEVIYTPRTRREPRKGREDDSGSHFESPQIFEQSGIPFATASLSNSVSMGGLAGRDLTSLPLEAAFAVRGGASEKAALESITIVPARMMGLEDRIGSLEVGKDADLLILNGQPLDYRTYVEQAIVAGRVSYDREQDRVFPVYPRK